MSNGTALIKAEYLISTATTRSVPDDDAAEGSGKTSGSGLQDREVDDRDRPSGGRQSRKKEKKQRGGGANKNRRFGRVHDDLDLCFKVTQGIPCEFGSECKYNHDIPGYLASKPHDLRLATTADLSDTPPFVVIPSTDTPADPDYPSIDTSTRCPVHSELGECKYGIKCRFLGGHYSRDESGAIVSTKDEEAKARAALTQVESNYVTADILKSLRTKKYPTPLADAYLRESQPGNEQKKKPPPPAEVIMAEPEQELEATTSAEEIITKRTADSGLTTDAPDATVRFAEKKRLHWQGKTYLAPLTTVGNLPFRRLCVSQGADITCGEMGLATSFLSGSKEEWSLVRRHPSESIFGVQLAGNKPNTLVPTAEAIGKECGSNIDFVDVNCGCPIDLIFNSGSGSALLDSAGKLGRIITGMNRALGEIPVTVKLRTGIKDNHNVAHKLMPRASAEWGAGCITLHGRSRQQRYTKLADWDYTKICVDAVRAREKDEDLPSVPIFGGGDCFSSESYWTSVEKSGVDGIMIGRGALIKPWIFTEVKEKREWDISSRERLDLIRQYAEYGLCHFGSDTSGVNTTRRYLCEALSFQHRYIPIGLLETLPGRINDRAPSFRCRDELETLLASTDSNDWVRISEMFLGKAPEGWLFTPKHKSNAYESQG